ncbi:MAG: hypothetical protein K2N38_01215 [Oscillospiraceae bacterium]|nr:hypothetical protein [Oscillospiraceae bacterium]
MTFVMNEKKYAETIIRGGDIDKNKNRLYTANVMARYYRHIGYDDREIKVAVERLIREKIPDAPDSSVDFWVRKSVETSKKRPLCVVDGIVVTKPEMERIKAIHSDKYDDSRVQKLAFTLLCLAKFGAAGGIKDHWVNTKYKHVFSIANIKGLTVEKQCLYIHDLYKTGYIDIIRKIESHGIKVLGVEDGEPEVEVKDINEAGMVFEEYSGKKFVRCEKCGKMVPVTNGRNLYCSKCAAEIDREKARERMRKAGLIG